jgi:hypothetical protein
MRSFPYESQKLEISATTVVSVGNHFFKVDPSNVIEPQIKQIYSEFMDGAIQIGLMEIKG